MNGKECLSLKERESRAQTNTALFLMSYLFCTIIEINALSFLAISSSLLVTSLTV